MEDYNWLIRNTKDDSFWTNETLGGGWSCCIGWVDYSSCQVFTQKEKDELYLPLDGMWEKL